MFTDFNKFTISLLVWITLHIGSMYFLSETLLAGSSSVLYKKTAHVSGLLSAVLNAGLIPAYLLCLGVISFFTFELMGKKVSKKQLVSAFVYFNIAFILYNILKISNTMLHRDSLSHITPSNELFDALIMKTDWFFYNKVLDYSVIFFAAILFLKKVSFLVDLTYYEMIIVLMSLVIPLLFFLL